MKKVLIIEDEEFLRDIYLQKISEGGFSVFWADNVKDGVKLLKERRPNLVVLDILLMGKNGISFLKALQEFEEDMKPVVIVLSNYDDPAMKKQALGLGAKEYLIKTQFTPNQILEKVKSYIGQ